MIIDAHQHFWDLDRLAYPWLDADGLEPLRRSYDETGLDDLLATCGVDRTVLVQSLDSAEDTDFMLEVADRWSRVAAVVGWVPLTDPDAAAAAVAERTKDPRFVGVRHLIHDEPDEDWLLREDVGAGLEVLALSNLTFDVVAVTPRHLAHVPVIAAQHPSLRIVIDHLAKPPIAAGPWQPWADLLARAARHPNVYAKLSGLNTAAKPGWTADDLRPYVEHALRVFGPERLMFGGDWPVATLADEYERVWTETGRVLADLDEDERALVLGGTAAEFYRIPGVSA
ncbi:L-fuconolactonase [Kribbella amoyensis]|uniref:L-fuconolactonase n=1 Tax=Kribbella amoyensis TaxID=996641 RepID=A0A561B8S9_9ACTN|nr:amidohydrolase family protein [Kribbella amoyensis]TWD75199.1 L-fuconolactonase [Kribbella amoyensis]